MQHWKTLKEIYEEVGKLPFLVKIKDGQHGPYVVHSIGPASRKFIADNSLGDPNHWDPETEAKLLFKNDGK